MATLDMVRRIISEGTDIDVEAIEEGTTLESLGLDSLDMVELVCDLEEACGIEFGDAQGIKTVGQLVSHIDERL